MSERKYTDVTISQARYDELRIIERNYQDLEYELKKMQAKEEWHEVTDPPSIESTVLVLLSNGNLSLAHFHSTVSYFDAPAGDFMLLNEKLDVTHWRKLPALPVEVSV